MVRSVYFDPFGSQLAGYRAGVQDEMGLQRTTRDARAMDWEYNNIAPLRLQGMQREEDYQQYFDPYKRRAADINERMALGNQFDAQNRRFLEWGNRTADYAPAAANYAIYNAGRYYDAPQFMGPVQSYARNRFDAAPIATNELAALGSKFGLPPGALERFMSQYLPYEKFNPQIERSIDQDVNWDRSRQWQQDNTAQIQATASMQNAANNVEINAQNARTNMQNADTRAQQQPYPGGASYWQGLDYPATEYGGDAGQ